MVRVVSKPVAVAATLSAAVMFGLCAALVARMSLAGWAAWGIIGLSAGVGMSVWQCRRGTAAMRAVPAGLTGRLAACTLLANAPYFAALQFAPAGPAAALHLAAPVLLVVAYALSGRRPADRSAVLTCALLAGGLAVLALARPDANSGADGLLLAGAYALALCSAAGIALLGHLLHSLPESLDPRAVNALRVLAAGSAVTAFAALAGELHGTEVLVCALLGLGQVPFVMALLVGLRRLGPVLNGSVMLAEAPVAALAATVLFGAGMSAGLWLATGLVCAAVIVELRRRDLAAVEGGLGDSSP